MSLKILFNEDTRVKLPATIHFLRLGYQYRSYSKALENSVIDFKTKIFIDSRVLDIISLMQTQNCTNIILLVKPWTT